MENFSELIKKRRSTRKFTDEELSQDEVVALLKAALMSPSSKRTNCWQFVVVDDKEMLERLSHCKAHGAEFLGGAPLAIVVLGDPLVSDVWIEDTAIASLMIQLQAEDLGLGSCWLQLRLRPSNEEGVSAEEFVNRRLGAPDNQNVEALLVMGHIDEAPTAHELPALPCDKVHAERW